MGSSEYPPEGGWVNDRSPAVTVSSAQPKAVRLPHPPVLLVLSKISFGLFWAVVFLSPPLIVLVHKKQDAFCQSISVLNPSLASEQNCHHSCYPKPHCGQASWTGLVAVWTRALHSAPHSIPFSQSSFVSPSYTLLNFTIRRAHPNFHLTIKHILYKLNRQLFSFGLITYIQWGYLFLKFLINPSTTKGVQKKFFFLIHFLPTIIFFSG